jgi:hypothetical protein
MAGRAFGVEPVPSAHLRHREATGVALAERSSVTRGARTLERSRKKRTEDDTALAS